MRIAMASVAGVALVATLAATDLSGVWTISWEPDFGGHFDAYGCTFKPDGRQLKVDCPGDAAWAGEVDERKVTLRFHTGQDGSQTATLVGELNESSTAITGTWHLPAPEKRDGKFTARKQ